MNLDKSRPLSFSSVESYKTCPYSFKLNYIDGVEQAGSWFGEIGILVHSLFEKYWKEEIDIWDLEDEFDKSLTNMITMSLPAFQLDFQARATQENRSFFETFSISKSNIKPLIIEERLETELFDGYNFVGYPDFVYDENGIVVLMDYKTSTPHSKRGWDKKKLASYSRQLHVYGWLLERSRGILVDKMKILFTRLPKDIREYWIEYDKEYAQQVIDEFIEIVKEIESKDLNDFKPNVNKYFCSVLCGSRNSCEYWRK